MHIEREKSVLLQVVYPAHSPVCSTFSIAEVFFLTVYMWCGEFGGEMLLEVGLWMRFPRGVG